MQFIIVTSFGAPMAGSMDHEACYTATDNDGCTLLDIGKNQSVCWLSHPLQWKHEQPANLANLLWRNESMNNNQCCIRINCVTKYKTIWASLALCHHFSIY